MEISNNFLATNEKKFHNSPIFFCFWRFQKKTKQNLNDFYSIPARIPIRQIRRNRRNFQHFGYFFSSLGHFLLQKKFEKTLKNFQKMMKIFTFLCLTGQIFLRDPFPIDIGVVRSAHFHWSRFFLHDSMLSAHFLQKLLTHEQQQNQQTGKEQVQKATEKIF